MNKTTQSALVTFSRPKGSWLSVDKKLEIALEKRGSLHFKDRHQFNSEINSMPEANFLRITFKDDKAGFEEEIKISGSIQSGAHQVWSNFSASLEATSRNGNFPPGRPLAIVSAPLVEEPELRLYLDVDDQGKERSGIVFKGKKFELEGASTPSELADKIGSPV